MAGKWEKVEQDILELINGEEVAICLNKDLEPDLFFKLNYRFKWGDHQNDLFVIDAEFANFIIIYERWKATLKILIIIWPVNNCELGESA